MGIFSDPLSPWRLPWRWLYPADWCAEGFGAGLEYLEKHPELLNDGNLLSDRAGKSVWKVEIPDGPGTRCVVCKVCEGKKPWRYIFDLSPPAREWRNSRALSSMGVPAAEVLAYRETRRCGKLERSFLVTNFIAGTRNGCDFMSGGSLRDDLARRQRFCELVAMHLAVMHRRGFFHKALHVRNILYRGVTPEHFEVFFVDLARCRILQRRSMEEPILFDLYTFLRDLELPASESSAFLSHYLENSPECPFDFGELKFRLRSFFRHGRTFDVIGK